ncbi:MAG: hypothetical protein ACK5MV_07555 [Aminipila sp.]
MENLVAQIPYILEYVVPGYVLLYLFHFVALGDVRKCDNVIIKSVVLSFIMRLVPNTIKIPEITFVIPFVIKVLIIPIILGYALGQMWKSKRFNDFLLLFKINRTTNENLWADVIKEGSFLRFYNENPTSYIQGQCKYCGEGNMSNLITVSKYQEFENNKQITPKKDESYTSYMIVDINKFKKIEVLTKK